MKSVNKISAALAGCTDGGVETSTAALISLSRYTSIVRAIRGRVVKLTDAACKVTYVACLRCEYSLKILFPMARPTVPHRLPSSFGVLGGLHNRLTRSYTQNPSGIQDEFASAASPEYWPSCGQKRS